MRRIPVFLLLLLLTAAGCTDKNSVPSGILPRDKMEKVLRDIIQADQYAGIFLARDSAKVDVRAQTRKLYDQVFLLNQVSREQFRKSYQYYLDRPDKSKELFDSLTAHANRQRTEYYNNPLYNHPAPAAPPPAVTHPSIPPSKPLP